MADARITVAQRGVRLGKSLPGGSSSASGSGSVAEAPLPAPAKLPLAERHRILDGFEAVIGGAYTHLPLKRARYGFDPVQRLRILRTQATVFDDLGFHSELAAILTQLRDYHTRYTGPKAFAGKVAVLPFMVEMYGPDDNATYLVSKVGKGLETGFVPGVLLQHWNGVPIDRAVLRHSNEECAGRPDSLRAASLQSLCFRSLQYGPLPDEEWVVVGYRKPDANGQPTGPLKEVRVPWAVVDPQAAADLINGGPSAPVGTSAQRLRLRRTRAVNPAAAAVRLAKMLLFAPEALVGRTPAAVAHGVSGQAKAASAIKSKSKDSGKAKGSGSGSESGKEKGHSLVATNIDTQFPDTLRVQSLQVPGGSIGYLRIWAFDTEPDAFVAELQRLIPSLPPDGLIIDVRGNPGGYIVAAERALQLFTPQPIEPVRFSVLATPYTRDMAALQGSGDELAPWKDSLDAAVRNGEPYSQPLPITDPADCNDIGQLYGGPVMLVADTGTYSSGDLFSAGFVDNRIGPFLCVGAATGAGGANVWEYADLRQMLAGTALELPTLTSGAGLSFAFRRATRSGPSEGLTIEDVGIAGEPYAMTRNDLLAGNGDLLLHCLALLRQLPLSAIEPALDKANRKWRLVARGLDRIDAFIDGHPVGSFAVAEGGTVEIGYAASAKRVEAVGFKGRALLQRRRIVVKA